MLKDNDTLNESLSVLKSAWSTYSSLDSRLALFGANPDLVGMMLSPVSKKMKIIHIIKNLGGYLTAPDNQLVGLVGMTVKAFPILISSYTIGANLDIEVPLVSDIKAIQNEDDFFGLEFKTKENYSGAPLALLPPFLAKVIMETKNYCPKFLFQEFMAAMFTFDLQSPLGNERVWGKSGCILQFLWAASQSLLQEAPIEGTAKDNAVDWQEIRSSCCIFDDPIDTSPSSSPTSNSSSSMLALSTSIQAQKKVMEKIQDSVEQSSSDRKEKRSLVISMIQPIFSFLTPPQETVR